jgi:hypothetical protein
MTTPTIQTLPFKAPRKHRKPETSRFIVKWIDGDTMRFQWFKRDSAACAFQQQLVEQGFQTRLLMK